RTVEEAERFIRPSLSHLYPPFLMRDMDRAVDRMIKAIDNRERVLIYGDYDVDGITSTAVLVAFLKELGMAPDYYIPHRVEERYGLNIKAVRRFGKEGVRLLITVDCGVSNHEEIREAARLGIDTIVIDHHEIQDDLPPAVAVLNPKRKDCPFPFDGLAGVGVAFHFLIALRARLREGAFWQTGGPPNLKRYLDLVSLGTIADMVPLVDENRILVKFGLEELSVCGRRGIQALKEVAGLDGMAINTDRVAFQLSPRLNACGRLDHAGRAVELLLADRMDEAKRIASGLEELNRRRHALEERIFTEILEAVHTHPEILRRACLFCSSRGWHPGVIGIVASRLVERFWKPTVLISLDREDLAVGSARGIEGVDLYRALSTCRQLLRGFGGHRLAAGFRIYPESVPELQEHLERALSSKPERETAGPPLLVDAEVTLAEIDRTLIEDLLLLEPYGIGNPRPLFLSRNLTVCERRIVGKGSLRLRVMDGQVFDAIGFRMGDRFPLASGPVDLVFTPRLDEWMGSKRIRLEIEDLLPHQTGRKGQNP
ncbi:MAG: single-stranded-DNA-specific exonuclease RecJ, partial [Deltaproteobacteria bacterium]|nr:single-stranded-DNA-specific exonuclease RecJ [Deltaproteobacteria bacterium]